MARLAFAIALAALAAPSPAAADRLAEVKAACEAARDEAGHEAALARLLTVETDPAVLRLAGADRLLFPFRPQLTVEGGALTFDGGDDPAGAAVTVDQARAILRARAAGKLIARIGFHLSDGEALDRPCVAVGGGRFLRVRAAPLWVDLLADGEPALRLTTPRGASDPASGALPVVELSTPTVAGTDQRDGYLLAEAALPLKEAALDCYRAAPRRPGAIALSIAVAGGGAVNEVSILIDSLHEEGVRVCVERVARALHFPRTHRGGYVTTTIKFELEPKAR